MSDRTIRNLANLGASASTSRVLNLLQVGERHGHTEAWKAAPLFRNPSLNRALIVKHRLRRNEIEQFRVRRHVATKIILPIDATDLGVGGRYVFINQIGFDRTLQEAFGIGCDHPDHKTLALIDDLPGLDPFLLREQLRRKGHMPDACYFNISEADLARMAAFVAEEITPLVTLSLGPGSDLAAVNPIARLTARLMSNTAGGDLSALGQTLLLRPDEYEEGLFCWKGFLYYKWTLRAITGEIARVIEGVLRVRPTGRLDHEQSVELDRVRAQVYRRIRWTVDSVIGMLRVYDDAFQSLTKEGRPTTFGDFLREAPSLFSRVGERIGALHHIVSFWTYRMGPGKASMGADELIDLLSDFEISLSGYDRDEGQALAA